MIYGLWIILIARSCSAEYFFLWDMPEHGKPIFLNGAIHVMCGILKIVVASAAEDELGALFMNYKEGKSVRLILKEMGHP